MGVGRHQKDRDFGSYAAMIPMLTPPEESLASTTTALVWMVGSDADVGCVGDPFGTALEAL